jgi:hypothetical protein
VARRGAVGVVLAALGLAGVIVAAVLVLRSGPSPTPRDNARKACDSAAKFEREVKRNADVDTVNRHLNRARRQAHLAEEADSQYVGLASGLEALRIAIDRNDAQAAKVGIAVVRDECGVVRAPPSR